MDQIDDILTRGVANIIPNADSVKEALQERKLNIYLGIDPTATRIHLGHAVPLRKLQQFAALGHHVTFLIGDFTALIGDTSDKDSERPVLTTEEIENNFKEYKKLAEKLVDFSKVKVRYNSEWLKKLTFEDIVKLCQHFSIGDFVSRELIRKRLDNGKRVALHEVLYPVMQGYDSYEMDTDLQIGGTDQTFNMQAGRTLQKDIRKKDSFVLATQFLMGTDGQKMSKTGGNAIWLDDSPHDMYGKVMSITDSVLLEYFTLATNLSLEKIHTIEKRLKEGENPLTIKKELALQIVSELYDENTATDAQEYFEKTVQHKEIPTDINTVIVGDIKEMEILEILTNLTQAATSRSEARRMIEQGGVEIDGEKLTDPAALITITNGMIIKAGKRKFIKLTA